MKVAIFGRTIDKSSWPRLSELIDLIGRDPSVQPVFYGPFYSYLQQTCPQLDIKGASFFSSSSDIDARSVPIRMFSSVSSGFHSSS